MTRRANIPQDVRREVLIEAGYRCAVPTCRTIGVVDVHHIVLVAEGGKNTADNLIALCPTCHAMHHRGAMPEEAIRVYKGMLVSLNQAFDKNASDLLLFLALETRPRGFTSTDVLRFVGLIVAGLVCTSEMGQPKGGLRVGSYAGSDFTLDLTEQGRSVVEAWKHGNKDALDRALEEGAGPSK